MRTADGPLAAWRTVPSGQLGETEAAALAAAVSCTGILREPLWNKAKRGDAAAAAALGIRYARACGADSSASDLVMGSLLLLARRGDATAPAVIALALRALARRRPDDPRLPELAARWARPGLCEPRT